MTAVAPAASVDLTGVDPDLASRVKALIAASHGRINVQSGFRTHDQQAKLYAKEPNLAAPPGHSNHEKGLAVDLGGDYALIAQLAPQFGLVLPMSWEPWHVELPGTHKTASPLAYTTSPYGDANPTTDPNLTTSPQHVFATAADAMRKLSGPVGEVQGPLGEQTGPSGAGTIASTPSAATEPNAPAEPGAGQGTPTTKGLTVGAIAGNAKPGQYNLTAWSHDFLTAGGFPTTPQNMQAIEAWARAEGGIANNNPLNTTQGGYAGHTINSVGVMNYNSYDDSIKANLQALNNGRYGDVIAALKAGNDPHAVANAVGASPWGTSGSLMNKILAG